MNLEELIIAFFRILASTIVFKFNFIGGLFVIFIDFSDLIIMNMINLGGVRNYQSLRQKYYEKLKTFKTFGRGWTRRVTETTVSALRWV